MTGAQVRRRVRVMAAAGVLALWLVAVLTVGHALDVDDRPVELRIVRPSPEEDPAVIDTTVHIVCDAVTPDGELCEAEFQMDDWGQPFNPLEIAHQLQQRGWITERQSTGFSTGYRTLCPLHVPAPCGSTEDR